MENFISDANNWNKLSMTLMQMTWHLRSIDLSTLFHVATCPLDMLNYIYSEKLLDLYNNLSMALIILLTLHVSLASGERSFKAVKLIKTYMKSTMGQKRLTELAFMSIERDVHGVHCGCLC